MKRPWKTPTPWNCFHPLIFATFASFA
jgi:hypothetical protein